MTNFIYAWFYDQDFDGWLLTVSEKDYFEAEGAVQSSYADDVYEELELILHELDCSEVTDSTYELGSLSKEEVEGHLRELENFERNEEFSDFLGV